MEIADLFYLCKKKLESPNNYFLWLLMLGNGLYIYEKLKKINTLINDITLKSFIGVDLKIAHNFLHIFIIYLF